MVADHAVMGEVAVGHNPVVVADTGFADTGDRTEVERRKFADGVAVADNQLGRLVAVFFVLRNFAKAGKLEMRLFSPMVVWPLMTTCGPISVFAPICTLGPMMLYGPTLTLESSSALGVNDGGRVDEGHVFPFLSCCREDARRQQVV